MYENTDAPGFSTGLSYSILCVYAQMVRLLDIYVLGLSGSPTVTNNLLRSVSVSVSVFPIAYFQEHLPSFYLRMVHSFRRRNCVCRSDGLHCFDWGTTPSHAVGNESRLYFDR